MEDPANKFERICWSDNQNLLNNLDYRDLEDPKGYYALLGCSKASSDEDVSRSFAQAKSAFKELARTHHPDKANGNEEMIEAFTNAKDKYEKQKLTMDVLGGMGPNGYADRVGYDILGEKN